MKRRAIATLPLLATSCATPPLAAPPGPGPSIPSRCEESATLRGEAQRLFEEGRLHRAARAQRRADELCAAGSVEARGLRARIAGELSGDGDARALFREGLAAKREGDGVRARRAFERAMAALAREMGEEVRAEVRPALWTEVGPFPPIVWSPDGARVLERSTQSVVDATTGIGHMPPGPGDVVLVPHGEGLLLRGGELFDFTTGARLGRVAEANPIGAADERRRLRVGAVDVSAASDRGGRRLAIDIPSDRPRVVVWDTARREIVFTIEDGEPGAKLSFSSDDRTLSIAGKSKLLICDMEKGPPCRARTGSLPTEAAPDERARFSLDEDTWTVALPPPASAVRLIRSERPVHDYLPPVLDPSGKRLWIDGVTVEVASGSVLSDRGVEGPLAPQLAAGSGELFTLAFPELSSWQWERGRGGGGVLIPRDAGRVTFDRQGAPLFVEPITARSLPKDAPAYGAGASRRVFRPLSRSNGEIVYLDQGRFAARDGGTTIRVGSSDPSAPALRFSVPDSLGFAASPDGAWIATTDADVASGAARIWDSRTGAAVAELREGAPFVDVAFSPNGAWAVTLSTTGVLYVWNVSNHFAKARSLPLSAHEDTRRRGLAFSADGRLLASRSARGYRIWDFTRGAEVGIVDAPGSSRVLGFSLDGANLWTDDGDHLTARPMDRAMPRWSVFGTPEGRALVGLSSDGRVRVLGDAAAARRAMACRAGRWVYPFDLCEDALSGP